MSNSIPDGIQDSDPIVTDNTSQDIDDSRWLLALIGKNSQLSRHPPGLVKLEQIHRSADT
ncbi:MAG: hypothetical protein HN432_13830 [Gammaproteobacteria bacterium]|nr:hypothetical protein [Gammaproteobacteria bacterium]